MKRSERSKVRMNISLASIFLAIAAIAVYGSVSTSIGWAILIIAIGVNMFEGMITDMIMKRKEKEKVNADSK